MEEVLICYRLHIKCSNVRNEVYNVDIESLCLCYIFRRGYLKLMKSEFSIALAFVVNIGGDDFHGGKLAPKS